LLRNYITAQIASDEINMVRTGAMPIPITYIDSGFLVRVTGGVRIHPNPRTAIDLPEHLIILDICIFKESLERLGARHLGSRDWPPNVDVTANCG
jgi:hypothetical protein